MKQKINHLMDLVKSSMSWKTYLALMDEDGNIHYNNFNGGLKVVLKNLVPVLKTLDEGDYQVKNLEKTRLITIKVSDSLALVVESYAKEGVLIFTLKSITEKLKKEFAELDFLLTLSDMAEEETETKTAEQLV